MVPKRAVEFKRVSPVLALEEPSGNRPDPHLASRPKRDHPKFEETSVLEPRRRTLFPRLRLESIEVARSLWVFDLRRVAPRFSVVVRARKLGAPMSMPERRPNGS